MKSKFSSALLAASLSSLICAADEPDVLNLWPGIPPGETEELPPEADKTKPTDKLIAGRRIIRLGNVSTPQVAIYRPSKAKDTGAAIIIAPGGGHHILAYDLEGTEVAEWLNSIGVTAIVLKYRVPGRDPKKRWFAAVQDTQRAMSLIRSKAREIGVKPNRIGLMGFSAGGQAAALTALFDNRTYRPIDEIDDVPFHPDFVALIYPGGLVPRGGDRLEEFVQVNRRTAPFFFAHANDDHASPLNSALLYVELKKAGSSAELHIYESGGHGYGLRETEKAVTTWPDRMQTWLEAQGLLKQ
mgnify:CR=1 FL=1